LGKVAHLKGKNMKPSGINRRLVLSTLALLPAFQSQTATAQQTKRRTDSAFSFAVYGDSRSMMYLPYKSDQREEATKLMVDIFALVLPEKVAEEVERQLDAFRRLLGRNPTHLDSHQHVHRQEPVLSILREAATSLSIPLRSFTPEVQYCGDFYGQTGEGEPYPEGISVDGLLKLLSNLPPGITELGCHPGDDPSLDSVYRLERKQEMNVLCDARVRAALTDLHIRLCSFAEIRNLNVTPSR